MVQDHGAAREDQAGVGGPRGDVAAAGLAFEFVAEVAQPAQGEFAGVALGGGEGAAAPDAVEPAEERALGPVTVAVPALTRVTPELCRTAWPKRPPSSARMLKRLRPAASGARPSGAREESSQTALEERPNSASNSRAGSGAAVDPFGPELEPAAGRELGQEHGSERGQVLEGLQDIGRGGAVREVEHPDVGVRRNVVRREPVLLLAAHCSQKGA